MTAPGHSDSTENATNQSTIFGLFRHGETVWNAQKRIQGHGDSPLTTAGKAQLQRWAEQLATGHWQHIFVSDLGRAQETAALLNSVLQLPLTVDMRLREQSWGDWEGIKLTDLRRNYADELERQTLAGWHFRPPGGESRDEVCRRAFQALAEIQQKVNPRKVLVVCHMGIIKCILYHLAGRKFLPQEPPLLKKKFMHCISCRHGHYQISELNIPCSL